MNPPGPLPRRRGPRPQPGSEHDMAAFLYHNDSLLSPIHSAQALKEREYPRSDLQAGQGPTLAHEVRPGLTALDVSTRSDDRQSYLEAVPPALDQRRSIAAESCQEANHSAPASTIQQGPIRNASYPPEGYDATATEESRTVVRYSEASGPQRALQRPQPRYAQAPPADRLQYQEGNQSPLERNDTTASERSFVARMRERYAEEKQHRGLVASAPELSASGQNKGVEQQVRVAACSTLETS